MAICDICYILFCLKNLLTKTQFMCKNINFRMSGAQIQTLSLYVNSIEIIEVQLPKKSM